MKNLDRADYIGNLINIIGPSLTRTRRTSTSTEFSSRGFYFTKLWLIMNVALDKVTTISSTTSSLFSSTGKPPAKNLKGNKKNFTD